MNSESGGGSAPLIHLSCFGGLQVTAETPLGPAFLQPRVVGLLAIVAAAGSEGVEESRLLELLWSDTDIAEAHNSLAAALTALRRNGNGDALIAHTERVVLNPIKIDSDVSRFLSACERGDAEAVIEAYTGPFLEGVEIGVGPRFDEWMIETQKRFAKQHGDAMRFEQKVSAAPPPIIEPVEEEQTPARRWWTVAGAVAVAAVAVLLVMRRPVAPNREVEAAVARANQLWHDGAVVAAVSLLDSVVAANPDEAKAWQLLGEVRFRSGPMVGASVVAAREAFERAVRLDSTAADGWQRLLRIALIARDTVAAERAWLGLRQSMGPVADTAYGWLRSSWTDDSLPLQAELERAGSLPAAQLLEQATLLGFDAGRTTEALAFSEPLLGDSVEVSNRIRAYVMRAALHGAVGDWPRVDADVAALSRDWPWGGLMVAVAAALAPTRAVPAVMLRSLRERVMRAPLDTTVVEGASIPSWSRTMRLYLVGELSARLNDARGVQAAIDSLASPKLGELTLPRRGGSYAVALQAVQLMVQGDTAAALDHLDLAAAPVPLEQQRVLWVGGTIERRQRVVWLTALGRGEEAARWAASVGEIPVDLLLGPPPR